MQELYQLNKKNVFASKKKLSISRQIFFEKKTLNGISVKYLTNSFGRPHTFDLSVRCCRGRALCLLLPVVVICILWGGLPSAAVVRLQQADVLVIPSSGATRNEQAINQEKVSYPQINKVVKHALTESLTTAVVRRIALTPT